MYQRPLVVVEVDYVNELFLQHHLFEQHDANQTSAEVTPKVAVEGAGAAAAVVAAAVAVVDVEVVGLVSLDEKVVDTGHNGYDVEQSQNHRYDDDDENGVDNYSQLTSYS